MGSRYGKTFLVASGWYAVVAVALFINARLPREDSSCDDTGNFCFTAKDTAELLFAAVLLFLGASLLTASLIAIPLSRRLGSPLAAGTLAALAGSLVTVAGLFLWGAAA